MVLSFPFRRSVMVSVLLCLSSEVQAGETQPLFEDDRAIISAVLENDLFGGQDQNYTNGVRLSWLSAEATTPAWAHWAANNLTPLSDKGRKRLGIAVGQNMYTPENTRGRMPDPNDRPYAGWLYGSAGIVSDTGSRLDNLMLTVGVVGPNSYAHHTQDIAHHIVGAPIARGWDQQLHTEVGAILTFERKWRAMYQLSPFGAGMDITPHAGVNLGNINTDASVGATVRLGYDLPSDYGPPRIRPSLPGSDFFVPTQTLGGYLFAGIEGRAVGRNIFLDGNTFRDSPSVDKEILVGSVQAGFALTYEDMRLSYTHVFMTREFKQQAIPAQFGAITLSWRY